MIDPASIGPAIQTLQQFLLAIVGLVLILMAANFYRLNETRNRNGLFDNEEINASADPDVVFLLNKANEISTQLMKTVTEIFAADGSRLTVRELQLLSVYLLLRNRARRGPTNVSVLVFSKLSRKRYRSFVRTHADLLKDIFSSIYKRALADSTTTDFRRTLELMAKDLETFFPKGKAVTPSIGEMKSALLQLKEGKLALKGDIFDDLNFFLPRFGDFVEAKVERSEGPFKEVRGRILVMDGKAAQLMNLVKVELDPPQWEAFLDLFLRETTSHGKKTAGAPASLASSEPKKKTVKVDIKFAKETMRKDDKSGVLTDLLLEFRKYKDSHEVSLPVTVD